MYLIIAWAVCVTFPAVQHLILTREYQKHPELPWYERARLLWPSQVNLSWNMLALPIVFTFAPKVASEPPEYIIYPFFVWFSCYIATAYSGRFCRVRALKERFKFLDATKRWLVESSFIGPYYLIAIVSFSFSESEWTGRSTYQAFAVAVGYIALSTGGLFYLLEWFGWIKNAPEAVQTLMNNIAVNSKIPAPRTMVYAGIYAGAYAYPFNRWILFSDRVLKELDLDLLAAVGRHEMAHLTERWWVAGARFIAVPYLMVIAMARPISGSYGFLSWALIFAVIAATVKTLEKTWRNMEVRADAEASKGDISEREYSRALEKLYEINLIPMVLGGKETHPDLYDRLINLGAAPEYPRPKEPDTSRAGILLLVASAVAAGIVIWRPALGW